MPKKTVSKTETEIVTPAPVVVDAASPVAAAEKKSRKPKAVKTEAVETAAPVVSETAAPATHSQHSKHDREAHHRS